MAQVNFLNNRKSYILGLISGLLPAFGEGAVVIAVLFILAQVPLSKDSIRAVNFCISAYI